MRARIRRPNLLWRAFVLGGLTTLGVLSFNDDAWQAWEDNVGDSVPRTTIRAVFVGSVGLHVVEALLVRRWGRKAGLADRGAYTRTTLLYGFPSVPKARRAAKAALREAA
jgi:hypothetical protein